MNIFKFKIPNLKSIQRIYLHIMKGIRKHSYHYEGTLVVSTMSTFMYIKLV